MDVTCVTELRSSLISSAKQQREINALNPAFKHLAKDGSSAVSRTESITWSRQLSYFVYNDAACVLGQNTLLAQCLSPPRSKWVQGKGKADEMLGGYLRWTSIPSRRSSNTPSRSMLQKPG